MATFAQLKTQFETITGVDDRDDAELAIWFNQAQTDLAYDLGVVLKYTFEDTVAEGENTLPTDFISLVSTEDDCVLTPDGKMIFADGGDHVVYYRKIPVDFDGITASQVSELQAMLHNLIPMFAAARYWDLESEGDQEESVHASKWMNYYLQGKAAAIRRLDTGANRVNEWQVV